MSEQTTKSFPVHELAAMNLPGMPTTRQGWHLLVKTKKWPYIETHGRGRGGIRREYIPPPEVMALIESQQRGDTPPEPPRRAVAAPAPAAIPPSAPQRQRFEVESPVAPYAPAPAGPAPEMKDEWLAIALDALDYAIDSDSDRHVTALNKAKLMKKLLNLVAFHASQDGGEMLNSIEIGILIRAYADLLADRLPKVKDNREDHDYQRTKERLRRDKGQDSGGSGEGGPVH